MTTPARPFPIVSIIVLLVLSGCQSGSLSSTADGSPWSDGGPAPGDGGPPGPSPDAGEDGDGGPAVDGGTPDDGGPDDGGSEGGPPDDAGEDPPPGPCDGVSCGDNAACDPGTGECACTPGFVRDGGDCVAASPEDPAGRSATQVCERWDDGHRLEGSWEPGSEACDPGTMPRAAIDDALRRINMYRWLAGRGPVTDNPALHDAQMQCAKMMAANGRLSHEPPETWECYTEAGAGAAGSSNITYGRSSGAAAVAAYMRDVGVSNLGHRRWILNERLGRVGIGFSDGGDCLAVIDVSGGADRDRAAYPNAGPAPVETTRNDWSYHGTSLGGDPSVTVTRLSDGEDMPVTDVRTFHASAYRESGIGWTPSGWEAEAGEQYRVTITGSGDTVSYVVEPVGCGGP